MLSELRRVLVVGFMFSRAGCSERDRGGVGVGSGTFRGQ